MQLHEPTSGRIGDRRSMIRSQGNKTDCLTDARPMFHVGGIRRRITRLG